MRLGIGLSVTWKVRILLEYEIFIFVLGADSIAYGQESIIFSSLYNSQDHLFLLSICSNSPAMLDEDWLRDCHWGIDIDTIHIHDTWYIYWHYTWRYWHTENRLVIAVSNYFITQSFLLLNGVYQVYPVDDWLSNSFIYNMQHKLKASLFTGIIRFVQYWLCASIRCNSNSLHPNLFWCQKDSLWFGERGRSHFFIRVCPWTKN